MCKPKAAEAAADAQAPADTFPLQSWEQGMTTELKEAMQSVVCTSVFSLLFKHTMARVVCLTAVAQHCHEGIASLMSACDRILVCLRFAKLVIEGQRLCQCCLVAI